MHLERTIAAAFIFAGALMPGQSLADACIEAKKKYISQSELFGKVLGTTDDAQTGDDDASDRPVDHKAACERAKVDLNAHLDLIEADRKVEEACGPGYVRACDLACERGRVKIPQYGIKMWCGRDALPEQARALLERLGLGGLDAGGGNR